MMNENLSLDKIVNCTFHAKKFKGPQIRNILLAKKKKTWNSKNKDEYGDLLTIEYVVTNIKIASWEYEQSSATLSHFLRCMPL